MMTGNLKRLVFFKTLGILVAVVPTLATILFYFPLWLGGSGIEILSGFTVLLCVLAHVPLFKALKRLFNSSASFALWLVLFVAFFLLSRIADQMTVISFVGFVSNLAGAVLLKLGERYRE